ncbi:unnamed protein product [Diabrotica balteata]|uniref:Sodium/hydrogen exchanger n=1 Tax=Diabrotica balteata TaxID=107213 RepID=A0A9N9SV14_DIABA|nr:unnamed protein product [Diabrotica balteata]
MQSAAAARRYAVKYPNRNTPERRLFLTIDRRLRETGTFQPQVAGNSGRLIMDATDEQILEIIEEVSGTSTRAMAAQLNIPHCFQPLQERTLDSRNPLSAGVHSSGASASRRSRSTVSAALISNPVSSGAQYLQQTALWQSFRVVRPYVMYSLEHGVNLSRRACKTGYVLLTVLLLLLLIGNRHCFAKPPNHAADNHKQPSANLDTNSYDSSLYRAIPTPSGHRTNLVPVEDVKDNTQEEVITGLVTQKTPDKKEVTRYPIISVSFHRVETPFIIALWIFCASLSKIGFHMAPKLSEIFPESCLLIFVGVVIGVILVHITDSVHMSPLTPDTFFFYMLPPIILDAGYFMPNRLFFEHFGTILLFAVVGTIFNTLTIGASLWAVGLTGLFSCDTPLLDMFLFGSLISAVDPVAVLAVFEEIQVNEILYIVVFGESLLNDAVTVVLYHLFESYTEMGLKNILYVDMISGFLNFWVVAIGGTVIGVIWGIATSIVTKFTNEVRVIEPIFIFVMAYLAYLNAEIFHMSGILA